MEKIIKNITSFYNSLTSTQKLLFVGIIVLVLMLFYFVFISGSYRGLDINYKKVDENTLIEKSVIVYDRDECQVVDDIIDKILKIKDQTWYVENKFVNAKDLYTHAVTPTYKKKISKGKFTNCLNTLLNNVLGEDGKYDQNKSYMDLTYYCAEYDTYLIKLKTINGEDNYIGIRIEGNNYLITYIK